MSVMKTLEGIWNEKNVQDNIWEVKPRDYLWASELGKSPVDVYLTLKGVQPSNPPNMRSMRKFDAGNITEHIIEMLFKSLGLMIESQKRVRHQYPGLLAVSGKLDFHLGSDGNYATDEQIDEYDLPDFMLANAKRLVAHYRENYPDGFEARYTELKSTSSFMYDVYERTGKPSENHMIQLFHYIKGDDRQQGNIVYFSRDDARIITFAVPNSPENEAIYKGHIERISKYYEADQRPPLEPNLIFDPDLLKFKDNWKVKYSKYLTLLYGFKSQMHYEDEVSKMVARFNRVIKRIAEDKRMTDNNLEVIEEMKQHYPDFQKHVPEIKARLAIEAEKKKNAHFERMQLEKENSLRAKGLWDKYQDIIGGDLSDK